MIELQTDRPKQPLTPLEPLAVIEIPTDPDVLVPKISPESIRDIEEMGVSTPSDISESPSEAELTQLIEDVLIAHTKGGYYFRIEDIGKPELKMRLRTHAALLGFKSQAIKLDGKSTRVWLHSDYPFSQA
jgi:hypothetical protein